jgi:hypothetical protein
LQEPAGEEGSPFPDLNEIEQLEPQAEEADESQFDEHLHKVDEEEAVTKSEEKGDSSDEKVQDETLIEEREEELEKRTEEEKEILKEKSKEEEGSESGVPLEESIEPVVP